MHSWGDDWPHWDELYQAETFIYKYTKKWSLCRVMMKEKWGTLRYSYIFPPGGSVRFGFNIPIPYWKKTIRLSNGQELKVTRFLFIWSQSYIYSWWERLGGWVLGKAIKKACIKFPNVQKEILADWRDWE